MIVILAGTIPLIVVSIDDVVMTRMSFLVFTLGGPEPTRTNKAYVGPRAMRGRLGTIASEKALLGCPAPLGRLLGNIGSVAK